MVRCGICKCEDCTGEIKKVHVKIVRNNRDYGVYEYCPVAIELCQVQGYDVFDYDSGERIGENK